MMDRKTVDFVHEYKKIFPENIDNIRRWMGAPGVYSSANLRIGISSAGEYATPNGLLGFVTITALGMHP